MKIPKGQVIAGPKERLTWDEMAERYPNQWVGLNDIKYENDDGVNIESAIVAEIGDRDVLLEHCIDGKLAFSLYTTPDNFLQNWCFWR